MSEVKFSCDAYHKKYCTLLKTECFRHNKDRKCDFIDHHMIINDYENDPEYNKMIKITMFPLFIDNWIDYAKSQSPGKKGMTGRPLEKAVRKVLKSKLIGTNTTVYETGKKINITENVNIIADVLIEKKSVPPPLYL